MELIERKYKKTDIGIIPNDWIVIELSDVFDFKNGLNKEKKYFGYGTPIVNYMDVYKNRGLKAKDIQGRVSLSKQEIKNYEADKGDVFFTRTSETVEEVGITSVILEDLIDTVFSGFILRGRPKNNFLENEYKKYCFSISQVRKEITSKSSYTTRALTNGRLLSKVKIAIPPTKAEQTAIATALSDSDELITSLEKLIAKKKMLKQGAMQQLLKPKKGWEVGNLGKICGKITTGKLDANAMVDNGEYRFYTCAKEYYFINTYAFDTEALLVSGNGANVGYIHYYKGKFNAYQRTYVLTDFSENIHYVRIYMDVNLKNRITTEVNAGNTPYIKIDTLSDMLISYPKDKEEQIAITQIISDMDEEIKLLENKLDKYKMLKQGMMQVLLSGKIRLINYNPPE